MSGTDEADVTEEGLFAPATVAEARARHGSCTAAAKTVVREVARSLGLDRETYRERVTDGTVATARDAVFASLLRVRVGPREAYEAWRADYDGEVAETGSPDVDRVAWHVGPTGAVATTFHADREAAVATLRRQAFGRLYRPAFETADEDGRGQNRGRDQRGREGRHEYEPTAADTHTNTNTNTNGDASADANKPGSGDGPTTDP